MLQGIKIIDFTRLLPGPLATHLLAQMGAEVIKIESPKRIDYARKMGIKFIDGANPIFHQLNHNKTLKTIDYEDEIGKGELIELISGADALIEQFRPGAMDAWGLGYDEIKKINPSIVYVSLTGYGMNNDFSKEAGHDFNYLAYSGVMSLIKDENGRPIVPDTQFADIGGAYMAVMALQGALIKKLKTNKGSHVDVALSDAVMPFLTVPYSFLSLDLDYRLFNVINGKTAVNYSPYQCSDGKWLSVAALELKFWNRLCEILEKPDWQKQYQMELMNHVFPKNEVIKLFETKTRDQWVELFSGEDVCLAPILEIEELENSAFHKNKNTFEEFETAQGTKLKTVRLPFKVK